MVNAYFVDSSALVKRYVTDLHIQPSFAHAKFTSLTFLTADDRLLAIARTEGLHTDNPNYHP